MAVAMEQFVKYIEDSGNLAGDTIKDFVPPKATPKDAEELARELVRYKKLTNFQAEQIYRGKGKSLVLGNYVLMEKIGAGGMGQVFKARHRRMDRLVAVKLLPPAMTKDKAAIARFEQEVKAAAKISHPNIVTAYDADQANGVHFLVMELVEGSDLAALVKMNGPFSVEKAVNYILQAARGLEAAHKKGVVHRDVKPSNLLLDVEGNVKILDMGLARIESIGGATAQAELTGTGIVMGTVDYMAPEQAVSTKDADSRADIYSLGCSMFFLMTGKSTYEGETLMSKLLAHREHPIPSLRSVRTEVPEHVESVFKKMVAKKFENRYQTMSEVIAELEQFNSPKTNAVTDSFQTASEVVTTLDRSASGDQTTSRQAANINDQFKTLTSESPEHPPQTLPKTMGQLRQKSFLLFAAAILGMMVLAGIIISLKTKDGNLIVEVDQKDAMVQVLDEEGIVEVSQKGGGKITISVDPGKHRLKVVKDGFATFGLEFEMEKDGKKTITAKLEPIDPNPAMMVEIKPAPLSTGVAKKTLGFKASDFDAWVKEVAVMPIERQLDAVSEKLVKLNPGFDGRIGRYTEGPTVTICDLCADNVTDISPIRALPHLNRMGCTGTENGKGQFSDLSPLKGMDLKHLNFGNTLVSDLTPLKGMQLTLLSIVNTQITDLLPLKGMPLVELICHYSKVADLSPLEGMPFETLGLVHTKVSNLSPLRGMPLKVLQFNATSVSDLSPLRGMPLKDLSFSSTGVSDLSPLQGIQLEQLFFDNTPVKDLSPLKGMPLKLIDCGRTKVTDHQILKEMPLVEVTLDFVPERDAELLRSIKTLEKINGKTLELFWKEVEAKQKDKMPLSFQLPGFDKWMKEVTALPAEKQIEAVSKKLIEVNPGFDGNLTAYYGEGSPKIENGFVTELKFCSDNIEDISPVRALVELKRLGCPSSSGKQGNFHDISPLKSLNLITLELGNTHVSDLSPLKGMQLVYLGCYNTLVLEFSPLHGMPLVELNLGRTKLSDLKPLKDLPLESFSCWDTLVTDLSPFQGKALYYLNFKDTAVTDLSPLNGMPLKFLDLDYKPFESIDLLSSIKTLETINQMPPGEFLKEVEAKKSGKRHD
jgi:serine/threonine protein kinase